MKRAYRQAAIGVAVAVWGLAGLGWAADYPTREVTLIVAPGAGGGTDLLFRALAKATEPFLGKPILVVNRPGAAGAIGHAEIARAKPDGHTLGAVLQQIHLPFMRPELSYRWTDFTYIMMVNADPMVFAVKADSPLKTLKDLVEAARQNPGKVTVGNCGLGCISHIAAGLLERAGNVKFQHVPFDGHSPGRTALLGGHLDVMALTPPEAADFVKANQIRVLAVAADKRDAIIPDVPTTAEAGFPVVAQGWRSLGGPKGIPADVQKKIHDAFKKGLEQPAVQEFMKKAGFPLLYMDSAELLSFVQKERADWRDTLKRLDLLKAPD